MTIKKILNSALISLALLNFAGIAYAEFTEEKRIDGNKATAGYWTPPEVEVKDPNGNKKIETGEKFTIKWKVKSATHDKNDTILVDIYLIRENSDFEELIAENIEIIIEDTENDGRFDWIPSEDLIGDNYKIKIHATDGNGLEGEDMSDKTFLIE